MGLLHTEINRQGQPQTNLPTLAGDRTFWPVQGHPDLDLPKELFAANCAEGYVQDDSRDLAMRPYAILRAVDAGVSVEIVATNLRPWLDGLRLPQ